MKFLTTAIAVASLAAVASAQSIQLNNPTEGTVWTTGQSGYISWTGNCASQGNASKAVDIQLVNGPSTAVRFVTDLGKLDCSGSNQSVTVTVPTSITTGTYSLRVLTLPQNSYSTPFQINNPSAPTTTTAQTTTAQSTTSTPSPTAKPSSANSLIAGSLAVLVGGIAAALQFAL
ncbi:hypothetical protein BC939DRAFT_461955 [Gamsiella multidivaricata]|uniref:uncharacterized protein n=1 Tax=Gamsiella multidivaricata TaxID=101098 RepID=UPI00221E9C58|nr:uncharacterized protein BC939DRAFT_461955 [Gamsiella multidivaricata]KAG0353863.1 hypothetical protein BGZ54_001999 [Gamsiella multidivaricata]KAI7818771.1 hypothetical protein BC939DRAFT_461955 [Gamsiella multidivaricata]